MRVLNLHDVGDLVVSPGGTWGIILRVHPLQPSQTRHYDLFWLWQQQWVLAEGVLLGSWKRKQMFDIGDMVHKPASQWGLVIGRNYSHQRSCWSYSLFWKCGDEWIVSQHCNMYYWTLLRTNPK
jgi:hypothetical protein